MKRIKHSKYRNTGFLFEILVRQITSDTITNKTNATSSQILRKYFVGNTELGKELALYKTLSETRYNSDARANHLIDAVLDNRKRIDEKKLRAEKYNLIKEIKDAYPVTDMFETKIPDYKVYASIYKMFDASTTLNETYDPTDIVQCRYTILENITGAAYTADTQQRVVSEVEAGYAKEDPDLRLLAYRIMLEKFNDKYDGLDDRQKTLIREFINNVSNTTTLKDLLNTEVPKVKHELTELVKNVPDIVTEVKLNEAINHIDKLKTDRVVTDNQVVGLLMYYQLVKEVKYALHADD